MSRAQGKLTYKRARSYLLAKPGDSATRALPEDQLEEEVKRVFRARWIAIPLFGHAHIPRPVSLERRANHYTLLLLVNPAACVSKDSGDADKWDLLHLDSLRTGGNLTQRHDVAAAVRYAGALNFIIAEERRSLDMIVRHLGADKTFSVGRRLQSVADMPAQPPTSNDCAFFMLEYEMREFELTMTA